MFTFFDRLEDKIRMRLARHPVPYSLIGAVGIVLFWKGVWETADMFPFLTGPVSILISVSVLLASGLFVSFFIGDAIIISGIKGEKKIVEKTESEISQEEVTLRDIKKDLADMRKMMESICKLDR